jgi:hypothetical protein
MVVPALSGLLPSYTSLQVVVLATSILSTEKVLRFLPVQRLRRNTLFVDVLSVKVSGRACRTWQGLDGVVVGMQVAPSELGCQGSLPFAVRISALDDPTAESWTVAPMQSDGPHVPPCVLQVFPKQLLLSVLPNEVDILCTHPMFGPDSGGGQQADSCGNRDAAFSHL